MSDFVQSDKMLGNGPMKIARRIEKQLDANVVHVRSILTHIDVIHVTPPSEFECKRSTIERHCGIRRTQDLSNPLAVLPKTEARIAEANLLLAIAPSNIFVAYSLNGYWPGVRRDDICPTRYVIGRLLWRTCDGR